MKIGVLALQGAFAEHETMLKKLGVESFQIRNRADFEKEYDGMIIPGGESTVIAKLLRDLDIFDALKEKIIHGLPVYGTCAGLILLAKSLSGGEDYGLGTMDITARRNAYGRQLGSFYTETEFKGIGVVPMTFIRAPYIEHAENNVEVLATVHGKIVAAKQGNQLVTAFHPELNESTAVHEYFIEMIKAQY